MYYSAFSASLVRRPARRAVPIPRRISRRHSESDFREDGLQRTTLPLRTRSYSSSDVGKATAPLHRDFHLKAGFGILSSFKPHSRGFSSGTDDAMWKKIGYAREFVKTLGENLSKAKRIEGLRISPASIKREEVMISRRKDELRLMAKTVLDLGRSRLGNFRKGILSISRNPKAESSNSPSSNKYQLNAMEPFTKEGYLHGPGDRETRSWVAIGSCCFTVYDHDPGIDESQPPAYLINLQHVEGIGCMDNSGFYLQYRESDEGLSRLNFWCEDEATASSWVLAVRSITPNAYIQEDNG